MIGGGLGRGKLALGIGKFLSELQRHVGTTDQVICHRASVLSY